MNKLVIIVLALVVSVFTNVKGADEDKDFVGVKFTEPTGGKAEIKEAKDNKTLRFVLSNSNTPGDWKCEIKGDKFVFLEGPFKGQVYTHTRNANGKIELREQGGRKTVWTQE